MKVFNPAHRDVVIDLINRAPFLTRVGVRVVELGQGVFRSRCEVTHDMLNSFGGIHGGAYAAIMDSACYYCAYADVPEGKGFITIDLQSNYLRSARVGDVVNCESHVIKMGGTIILTEAICTDDEGRLLAQATSKLYASDTIQPISAAMDLLSPGEIIPPKYIEVDD